MVLVAGHSASSINHDEPARPGSTCRPRLLRGFVRGRAGPTATGFPARRRVLGSPGGGLRDRASGAQEPPGAASVTAFGLLSLVDHLVDPVSGRKTTQAERYHH